MYDYFYWKDFFTQEDLQHINIVCQTEKNNTYKDVPAYSNNNNKKLKNVSNVDSLEWSKIKHKFKKLINEIKITNMENYGYHIYDMLNSDTVLFNTYNKNDYYDWHKDGSNNSYYDLKFTVLINNSLDKYEGGDFQIFSFGGENTINEFNTPGSVLMFKSDIPHRVLPVENGIRNSIALFIKGNKFI